MEPSATTTTNSRKVDTSAMTGELISSDRNDKGRLVASGNACFGLPVGSVDLHHASAVQCSAKRNHSEAGMGRQLGDQVGITTALTTPPKTYSRKAKGECGERIGRKIDLLVAEIQASAKHAEFEHKRTCVSACCGSTVVDPPVYVVVTPGAVMTARAPRHLLLEGRRKT